MKIIHKRNYVQIVCIIFTIMSMWKVAVEGITGHRDPWYIQNFICMFVITAAVVFILSLHYYVQNLPLIPVILIQYLVLLALVLGYVWIGSFFIEPSKNAYRDMFLSLTIPYVVFVPVYYIQFFRQIKRANEILPGLKEEQTKDGKE